jgi:putative hydrolase of the HAD superfamily
LSKTLQFNKPEQTTRAVVSFDATGTLIHCPDMFEIYAEVLTRHGSSIDASIVEELFGVVFRELDCSTPPGQDRFASHAEGARGWWRWFLTRMCELAETGAPTRFAAAELFERFGQGDCWRLYPETVGVLDQLAERGYELVVISNWDSRLHKILADKGIEPYFHRVFVSSEEGVAKPNPLLFKRAMKALRVGPSAWTHIGDHALEDGEGAQSVGAAAIVLDRSEGLDLSVALDELP